jgi:hypothetical protein
MLFNYIKSSKFYIYYSIKYNFFFALLFYIILLKMYKIMVGIALLAPLFNQKIVKEAI